MVFQVVLAGLTDQHRVERVSLRVADDVTDINRLVDGGRIGPGRGDEVIGNRVAVGVIEVVVEL